MFEAEATPCAARTSSLIEAMQSAPPGIVVPEWSFVELTEAAPAREALSSPHRSLSGLLCDDIPHLPRGMPLAPLLHAPVGERNSRGSSRARWRTDMLWTIFVILVVMWLLGMVSSYTLGGFIHVLLLLAIAVVLINIIQGRRPI
jgi:hypothetical protein